MDISRFLRPDKAKSTRLPLSTTEAISARAALIVRRPCDEIVMSPGGVLGDCAPIILDRTGNLDPLPATERAKIQSPILRDFEDMLPAATATTRCSSMRW